MHLVSLVEGYSPALRDFENEMHGRTYANGRCKLRIREVKLYTSSFNQCGYNEVLADFMGLENMFGNNNKMPFKWKAMYDLVNLAGKPFGLRKIDKSKITPNPLFGKPRAEGGITYNAHFYNLGIVPDYIDENGVEQV